MEATIQPVNGLKSKLEEAISRSKRRNSYTSMQRGVSLTEQLGRRSFLYGCYAIELLPALAAGAQLTYGTVAIDEHQKPEAAIRLDDELGSWFVSLLSVFIVVGSLFSSLISSLVGRRWCLFLSCLCINGGLVGLYMATEFKLLLVGRILCGLGSGVGLPTSYLFLHETALPHERSTLAALNIFSLNTGNLFSLVVGWILPYELMPLVVALPSAVFCLCIFRVPESASYLLQNGNEFEAKANLNRLWGDRHLVVTEIEWLNDHLQAAKKTRGCLKRSKDKLTWPNIRGIIFVAILMLTQSFSGCDTIYNYCIKIAKMARLDINKNFLSVLLQCAFNIGFVLAPILVKYCKRKPHFVSSGVMAAIFLTLLGFGLSQDEFEEASDQSSFILFQVLPVASALGYAFTYGWGIGSLPFTLLGELLPDPVRNLGNSVATLFRYASVFLLLKLFPAMSDTIGLNGLFWFHAICCLLSALFVQIFVPETKNLVKVELGEEQEEDEEFYQI